MRWLLLWLALVGSVVWAKEAVRPGFHHQLQQVVRWQQEGRYRQAQEGLRKLQRWARNGLERALVQTYLAHAFLAVDRLDRAAEAARAALDDPALPARLEPQLFLLLGQIEVQRNRFRQARIWLRRYLDTVETPEPEIRYLAAYVEYRLGHYRRAAALLRAALRQRPDAPEDWYRLLLACHLENRQYPEAEQLFLRLLQRRPGDVRLWRQLAALYLQQGRDHHALAALVAAWHVGKLGRDQLLAIVRLYAQVGIPEKAARLVRRWRREGRLPDDARTLELEAALWRAAREWEEAKVILRRAKHNATNLP